MIDSKKVTEAVMEFMQNPIWKEIFTKAPAGAMERLAISFYFSKFHDQFKPEDFQEYRDLRDEYEKSLTEEDLNYLIENSEKDNAKEHYQDLLTNLLQSGGQPQGNMRFEKNAPGEESGQETSGTGDDSQPQEGGETKVEATETEETPSGDETEKATVVEEEKPAEEQPSEKGGNEKKKDLTESNGEAEKNEKYNTALSVALEYLQNEQKAIEGEKRKAEPPKTNS